ncbi:protein MKS1 [Trifolium repens]|nr:protein MKS1 [Trifolium repens]
MNFYSNIGDGSSSKKELQLQGPRPTPLRINKNSHKIKKPPLGPQAQIRQPVIIYTVSPKVIHTTPNEFMSLVQRLTGSSNSSSMVSMSNDSLNGINTTKLTDAPCATIEKVREHNQEIKKQDQYDENSGNESPSLFHKIFSQSSPLLDPSMVRFINDLSQPDLSSNRNLENNFFMQNLSNFISISPHTPSIDLFNNFLN